MAKQNFITTPMKRINNNNRYMYLQSHVYYVPKFIHKHEKDLAYFNVSCPTDMSSEKAL